MIVHDTKEVMSIVRESAHIHCMSRHLRRFQFSLLNGTKKFLTITREAAVAIQKYGQRQEIRRHRRRAAFGVHKSVRWLRQRAL